jgi:NAD(P)-dependent dehydrogenase (short-subunit alcohol dehydrogenase family)
MTETPRVAIVTGAAGGIGRAMVRGLLAAGIRVAGVDRDREPLEMLATSARQQGNAAELLTITADLTDDAAADAITSITRGKFGRIDILVNNAGIGPGAIRPDSWQRPLKFWEITPDQLAPLCCRPHHRSAGADEHRCSRDDTSGLGPDCECDDESRHDAECSKPTYGPLRPRSKR